MIVHEDRFRLNGDEFNERRWPVDDAKANIIIVHGYGEHCARYDYAAQAWNSVGFSVFSYDQRWHGRSTGAIGGIQDFETLPRELDQYLAHIRPDLGDLPTFLFAHSMGALVTARLLQTQGLPDEVRGVVFSSGLLAPPENIPPAILRLADYLGRFTPFLPVATLDSKGFSRDPAMVRAADEDPLNFHGLVKARPGAQLNRGILAAAKDFGAIRVPMLVTHGDADTVTPMAGSKALYDGARSEDKSITIYPGSFHEIMNDLNKDEYLADVAAWFRARI